MLTYASCCVSTLCCVVRYYIIDKDTWNTNLCHSRTYPPHVARALRFEYESHDVVWTWSLLLPDFKRRQFIAKFDTYRLYYLYVYLYYLYVSLILSVCITYIICMYHLFYLYVLLTLSVCITYIICTYHLYYLYVLFILSACITYIICMYHLYYLYVSLILSVCITYIICMYHLYYLYVSLILSVCITYYLYVLLILSTLATHLAHCNHYLYQLYVLDNLPKCGHFWVLKVKEPRSSMLLQMFRRDLPLPSSG
jgi:hypothetical protein